MDSELVPDKFKLPATRISSFVPPPSAAVLERSNCKVAPPAKARLLEKLKVVSVVPPPGLTAEPLAQVTAPVTTPLPPSVWPLFKTNPPPTGDTSNVAPLVIMMAALLEMEPAAVNCKRAAADCRSAVVKVRG